MSPARRGPRSQTSPSPDPGPGTPTWPAPSSTTTTTCATCSSARARARPPRASRSAASRSACSRRSASTSAAGSRRSAASSPSTPGSTAEEIFAARRGLPGARWRTPRPRRRSSRASTSARRRGDTLGGVVETVATGLPPGLGSHAQWDRKLDGRLAHALMSVQAVKGVEIGLGFETARRPGSAVHDEIHFDEGTRRFERRTNHAGGTEGGMSSGEPIVVRTAFKPLSTLMSPLHSVDIETKDEAKAAIERSDVVRDSRGGRDRRGGGRLRRRRGLRREVRRRLPGRDPSQPATATSSRCGASEGAPGDPHGLHGDGKDRGGPPAGARARAARSSTPTGWSRPRRAGPSPTIFATDGEAAFRELERDAVAARLRHAGRGGGRRVAERCSTPRIGGGSRAAGPIVCLAAAPETILGRIGTRRRGRS